MPELRRVTSEVSAFFRGRTERSAAGFPAVANEKAGVAIAYLI
jgi:hypothetical protein